MTEDERLAEMLPLVLPQLNKILEIQILSEFYAGMLGITKQEVLTWPWIRQKIDEIFPESLDAGERLAILLGR